MKKKILCAILSAMLIISSLPFAISAAPSDLLTGYEVELAKVDYKDFEVGDVIYADASGGNAKIKDKDGNYKKYISGDHYVDTNPTYTNCGEIVDDSQKGKVLKFNAAYNSPIGIKRGATQDDYFYTTYGKHPNLVKFEVELKSTNTGKVGYILLNGNSQGSNDICKLKDVLSFTNGSSSTWVASTATAIKDTWHKITLYVDFQAKKYIGFFDGVYQGEYTLQSKNYTPELFAFSSNGAGVFYINYMSISTILPYGNNTDISAYQDFTGATQYGYIMNNETASELNYGVYCAKFDSNDELVDVVIAPNSVAASTTGVLKNLPTEQAPDGGYCVYFVWENFTTLKPLFEQKEVR